MKSHENPHKGAEAGKIGAARSKGAEAEPTLGPRSHNLPPVAAGSRTLKQQAFPRGPEKTALLRGPDFRVIGAPDNPYGRGGRASF